MVVSRPIADWVRSRYFAGGLTYSGHPLACAAAVASIAPVARLMKAALERGLYLMTHWNVVMVCRRSRSP